MNYIIRELKKEEYILLEDFGGKKDDLCLCAEVNKKVVGAVWVRNIKGYGSVDEVTPEFAISLYKSFRGYGIGTEMMKGMLKHLKNVGYSKTSLAVQKTNYAFKMYEKIGFQVIDENEQEYIMVYYLK